MLQKELARLLDLSPAMVCRLIKKGMPSDDLDRAKRWRKRHIEPGRIKGARFDPKQPSTATTTKPAPAAASIPGVTMADVEAAGLELDVALNEGDQEWTEVAIQSVRDSLRQMGLETDRNDEAEPRLSLRVWVALCDYALNLDGVMARSTKPDELMTPVQFCKHTRPDQPTYPLQNHHTLSLARDWNDYALKGWPLSEDDKQEA